MPYIPAPGVLQVVQFFSTGLANGANVWHVLKGAGAWDLAGVNEVIDVFAAWEEDEAGDNRAIEVACTGFKATDLTSLAGVSIFRAVNITGNIAGPAAPLNATFAVKLVTGLRGRGTNGRVFWYGLSEEQMGAYLMDPIQAEGIRVNVESLITALGAAGDYSLAVLHKVVGGVEINPQTASVVVSAAYTDLFVDSQRNRLPGHKRRKSATVAIAP